MYICEDHVLRLNISMDYEVSVHVVNRATYLTYKKRNSVQRQPQTAFNFISIKMLIDIFVCCVFANEINILLIIKKTIELGNVRMIDK